MKKLLFLISVVLSAQQIKVNPITGMLDLVSGPGAANVTATSAMAVTSLAIDVSSLNLSDLSGLLVQCWSGASAPYSPVTVTSLDPATTSSVTANFASTANVTCRANSNGGGGASDAVTGASVLLDVGNVPRVATAGVLGESKLSITGGEATLFDDTAVTGNTKLVIKAGAGQSSNLQEWQANDGTVFGFVSSDGTEISFNDGAGNSTGMYVDGEGVISLLSTESGLYLHPGVIAATKTGSEFYALELQSSTLTIQDPTATTGSTKLVVKAGEGQSGLILQTQDNSGAGLWSVGATGIPQWVSVAEPACDATTRGQLTMVQGGAGVADTFRICSKDAADAYAWRTLI